MIKVQIDDHGRCVGMCVSYSYVFLLQSANTPCGYMSFTTYAAEQDLQNFTDSEVFQIYQHVRNYIWIRDFADIHKHGVMNISFYLASK